MDTHYLRKAKTWTVEEFAFLLMSDIQREIGELDRSIDSFMKPSPEVKRIREAIVVDELVTIKSGGLEFIERRTGIAWAIEHKDSPPDWMKKEFDVFTAAETMPDVVAEEEYVFRTHDTTWEIVYGRERMALGKSKGARIVHVLLERNESLEVEELDGTGRTVENDQTDELAGTKANDGLGTGIGNAPLPLTDERTIKEIKRKREELEGKIEDAIELKDTALQICLEKEMEELGKYYNKTTDDKGRPSQIKGSKQGAEKRVYAALEKFYKKIARNCPGLHEHLNDSIIKNGSAREYRPAIQIEWEL